MTKLIDFIRKLSLRTKMISVLILILFPYVLFTSINSYIESRDLILKSIKDNLLPLTSSNIYSDLRKELVKPVYISSFMANSPCLKTLIFTGENDKTGIKQFLNSVKSKYNFLTSFYVSKSTRNYYYFDGILKKVSRKDLHDKWFFDFLTEKKEYKIEIDTDQANRNELTIFINHKVRDSRGRTLGVTGVGLKMADIVKSLKKYKINYDCDVYFVDTDGVIQIHTDEKQIMKANIHVLPGINKISDQILDRKTGRYFYEYESRNKNIHLISRYVPEIDWHMIVEIDKTEQLYKLKCDTINKLLFSLLMSSLVIFIAIFTANYFQKRLSVLATTDELTGAANRREMFLQFQKFKSRFERTETEFSLIIFDIDFFKDVNDRYGHLVGDKVLIDVSDITERTIRASDSFFRWGGDEFTILSEGGINQALRVARRIKDEISHLNIAQYVQKTDKENIKISISCGISTFNKDSNFDELISEADKALYRAKENGRNRIEVAK